MQVKRNKKINKEAITEVIASPKSSVIPKVLGLFGRNPSCARVGLFVASPQPGYARSLQRAFHYYPKDNSHFQVYTMLEFKGEIRITNIKI